MERSASTSLTQTSERKPVSRPDDFAFRQNGNNNRRHDNQALKPNPSSVKTSRDEDAEVVPTQADREVSCDRRRPGDEEEDHSWIPAMPTQLIGKTVTPFLREHIPEQYAGKGASQERRQGNRATGNPNSKYCYRHRPDSKCRRAAAETKMILIQNELDKLSQDDQQAITHVWSLFSAAPSTHRDLMLQGIITQCCFPQLSTVSREVTEQLKIDFIATLPVEISHKILCYLDTVSLCKSAQVSRRWRQLADDDAVWHHLCAQHIDRKCTKCGFGLPLLERKRLRDWTRQRQLARSHRQQSEDLAPPRPLPTPFSARSPSPSKQSSDDDADAQPKRRCVSRVNSEVISVQNPASSLEREPRFRPWKEVYKRRWCIGSNWKAGRCSIQTFRGHQNGVTCLQLDDNILATGSYDATIKIWNLDTGEEIRTLTGHTRGIRSIQLDDSKLISASLDHTIKIWNWHTGECLSTLACHTDGVLSVNFDGNLLASGSIDRTVRIFNFNTKQAFCLRGHEDWVNSVSLCGASGTVFSASDDCTAKLWDLGTKQCIRTFMGHAGHVQQVLALPPDFEPDDEWMALPGMKIDNTDAMSVTSGRDNASPPHAMSGHCVLSSHEENLRASYGPAFADDSARPLPARYILTGGLDSTVRLWDSSTGRCCKTWFGHLEGIWGLAGDTLRVLTGANDGMVKIWEPRSGKCERSVTGHRGPVTCVGLSDSHMASGSEDGEVRLYSFLDSCAAEECGTLT